MKISIVTTLFHSEELLDEFHQRINSAASKITDDFEIIMVNDGSPDRSLEKAIALQKTDPRLVVIDLTRNFGHHKAIKAGLSLTKGDFVFLIDSDLEEAPELLNLMWTRFVSLKNVDVVYGVQTKRKGGLFERLSGYFFYKFLNYLLAEISYPENPLTARLMTKQYVQTILQFQEREYDICCSFDLAGFHQVPVEVEKGNKGKSHYTLYKKFKIATETITSSSSRPLVLIFFLGLLLSFFSIIYVFFIVIEKFFFDVLLGWTSILASIWFIGGIIMLSLGIIGIYISKIYLETKQRPDFIIKKVYKG